MRICLLCVEIFINKSGGFGRATRTIGRELSRRGIEVHAVVPRQGGQRPVEGRDGITILSFPKYRPWESLRLFREVDADVYHSSEPSMSTVFAQWAMPDRKHMITFRDPRNAGDWKKEFQRPARSKLQVASNLLYEHNPLVSHAVRRADAVYSIAHYLVPKIRNMYRLEADPVFLPTPVDIPVSVQKAAKPTVGYLARWDRVKRPEIFLELASRFPKVDFLMAGSALDRVWEGRLRRRAAALPNVTLLGRVDQFREPERHSAILSRCWVMVNASTKEALPNAFLEAAAHRCAILAGVDPDGFGSEFGYFVEPREPRRELPDAEDFERGLAFLLEGNRWRERGERGYAHVRDTFATDRAIELHIEAYRRLVSSPSLAAPVRRSADASAAVGGGRADDA